MGVHSRSSPRHRQKYLFHTGTWERGGNSTAPVPWGDVGLSVFDSLLRASFKMIPDHGSVTHHEGETSYLQQIIHWQRGLEGQKQNFAKGPCVSLSHCDKYIIIFQNKRLIDFKPLTKKRTKPPTGRFVECRRVKPETVAANQTLNFQPQLNTLGTFPDRGYAA